MNHDLANTPPARSWRDIPQLVRPRAMSREGRWRLAMAVVRTVGVGVFIGALGWGGWMVAQTLRQNGRTLPALAKSVPIKAPQLITSHGGVLDAEWLARTLALPKGVSLMEINLEEVRTRLLGDGQVLTATVTRVFPDRLQVKITERTPLARIKVLFGGEPRELLVARDGVIFAGTGFDRSLRDSLPWLAGTALVREGAWFRPIPQMEVVSDLLFKGQAEAPHLYETWHIVSLEHLEADHEIEVITKQGAKIVFNAHGSLFLQLARLDYTLEQLGRNAVVPTRIDLSLGREVPVQMAPASLTGMPTGALPATGPGRPLPAPNFQVFPNSQTKTKS